MVLTRATSLATFDDGFAFLWRLTKAVLIGFAMSTGVSLFILPRTARGGVGTAVKGYVAQTQVALKAIVEFVHETPDDVLLTTPAQLDTDLQPLQTVRTSRTAAGVDKSELAKGKVKDALNALNALDAQMQANLRYAKIEVAWGKLSSADLERISALLRKLLLTLSGISAFPTIIDHFLDLHEDAAESPRNSTSSTAQSTVGAGKTAHIVQGLRASLDELELLARVGLEYFINKLEIVEESVLSRHKHKPKPAEQEDIELVDLDGESITLDPESPDFMEDFTRCLKDLSRRKIAIEQLVRQSEEADGSAEEYSGIQHEYCLALYLFYMEDLVADAVSSLVNFAKSKVDDGTMRRSRIIYPTFLEWSSHAGETDEEPAVYSDFSQPREFEEGMKVANPSHMVPVNAFERWAGLLAKITRLLGSDLSMFGLRVACASLCLGIVALLQPSQEFFIRQRGVWAMIVVVLGMSPTSGQTLFGFFSRLLATVAAVALSFVSWYIVVGHTAGVLVFLYISNVILVSYLPRQDRYGKTLTFTTVLYLCEDAQVLWHVDHRHHYP